jgi:anti-sigma B factor antagonist
MSAPTLDHPTQLDRPTQLDHPTQLDTKQQNRTGHDHTGQHEEAPIRTVAADAARACVRLRGEIDALLAPAVSDVLEEHLVRGRRYLRLELSAVTFLDTTALSAILAMHHRVLAARGTLILTGVRNPVSRLIEITQLDQVLFIGGPRSDLDAAAAWN